MERRVRGMEGHRATAPVAYRSPGVSPSGSRGHQEGGGGHMRKRLVLPAALVVAAIVAAVLAAGSAGRIGANGPAGKSAPSGTVTLNGWQSSPVEDDLLRKVVKDFEKSHPKIKVNFDAFNNYQATM